MKNAGRMRLGKPWLENEPKCIEENKNIVGLQ
jgi:hypothetical protein